MWSRLLVCLRLAPILCCGEDFTTDFTLICIYSVEHMALVLGLMWVARIGTWAVYFLTLGEARFTWTLGQVVVMRCGRLA